MATEAIQAALDRTREGIEALSELLRQTDWEEVREKTGQRLRWGGRQAVRATAGGSRQAVKAAVVGGRLARRAARQAAERAAERREVLGRVARNLPSIEVPHVTVPHVTMPHMPHIEVPRRRRSMIGKIFNRFTLGFATGYVLGAKAGRERYEQIQGWWSSLLGNPTVRQAAERARQVAGEAGEQVASKLPGGQGSRQSVREVMTPSPGTLLTTATLVEAASKMRQHDAGAVIVVDESQKVVGIVTDRDVAVRAVAEGRDPKTTTVGDIASRDLQTLSPADSVADAVRLMRERNVRRLPVVENGRPVGVVSIGDLAQERDPGSVLADISRAPGNR